MISALLDRTLQLFGRAFLLAAFVPVAITTVAVNVVLRGLDAVRDTVNRWGTESMGKAVFEIAAWLVVVYLGAYLLYGTRTVLRGLFEGAWPAPALPLQRALEWVAIWWYRRRRARVRYLTERKNDTGWVLDTLPKDWSKLHHPRPVSGTSLDEHLENAARHIRGIERADGRPWKSGQRRHLRRALVEGRLVLASGGTASPAQAQAIAALARWYAALRESRAFRDTVRSLAAWPERRRAHAEVAFDADYPSGTPTGEARVRATALGNVLARLQTYSEARYGIPLGVLWPRLVHVLPDTARQRVDDTVTLLDFAVISATLTFAGGGVGMGVVIAGRDGQRGMIAIVASLGAFVVFTRVAVAAARGFAEEVQACVDLHRRALLAALGFPVPQQLENEKKLWAVVSVFLERAELLEWSRPSSRR